MQPHRFPNAVGRLHASHLLHVCKLFPKNISLLVFLQVVLTVSFDRRLCIYIYVQKKYLATYIHIHVDIYIYRI